jgi:hypothetical protein
VEMKQRTSRRDPERLLLHDSRSNESLTPPEALSANRAGAKFLWLGGTDAPLVQRVGVSIIGAFVVGIGLFVRAGSWKEGSWTGMLFSLAAIGGGATVLRNGFKARH